MKFITMKDWLELHPYPKPVQSDFYYVRIANEIFDIMSDEVVKLNFGQDLRKEIALSVAAYFEDVISDLGLWRSFTLRYRELYGKPVPFYDVPDEEEYYDDEINLEDVGFLVWSITQRLDRDRFINPDNPVLNGIILQIYFLLDKEFEKAPINNTLIDFILSEDLWEDFFDFKLIGLWLFYNSYLLAPYSRELLENELSRLEDKEPDENDLSALEYGMMSELLFTGKTGPLFLPVKEWLLLLLDDLKESDFYRYLEGIEAIESKYYQVISESDKFLSLRDHEGRVIDVLKSSFNSLPSIVREGAYILASLMNFREEWHVNGVSVWLRDDQEYKTFANDKEKKATNRKGAHEIIFKENNNYPLGYFKDAQELNNWFKSRFTGEDIPMPEKMKEDKYFVMFSSPDSDLEIVPNMARFINDERNPFYEKEEAELGSLGLLLNEKICSRKMLNFLIENNLLPETRVNSLRGKERGRELVKQNLPFLINFFRMGY